MIFLRKKRILISAISEMVDKNDKSNNAISFTKMDVISVIGSKGLEIANKYDSLKITNPYRHFLLLRYKSWKKIMENRSTILRDCIDDGYIRLEGGYMWLEHKGRKFISRWYYPSLFLNPPNIREIILIIITTIATAYITTFFTCSSPKVAPIFDVSLISPKD